MRAFVQVGGEKYSGEIVKYDLTIRDRHIDLQEVKMLGFLQGTRGGGSLIYKDGTELDIGRKREKTLLKGSITIHVVSLKEDITFDVRQLHTLGIQLE